MWYFCWSQQLLLTPGQICLVGSFNPFSLHIARVFFKKDRKCSEYVWPGPDSFLDYFWVSCGNQIIKHFFRIIMKKICLHQQKREDNDAIIFWYIERTTFKQIAFKQVIMNSWIINGLVNTDETEIAQILNKNKWRLSRKSADVSKIM